MSLDLFVILATEKAPSGDAWAGAVAQEHAPISFTHPFDTRRNPGFVPVTVDGRASGFYFGLDSYGDLAAQYTEVARIHVKEPVVYSLSFGGHRDECVAAMLSAAVLVARFDGIAFDPQAGMRLTAQQLMEAAKQCSQLPPT